MLQDLARAQVDEHLRRAAALLPLAGQAPAQVAQKTVDARLQKLVEKSSWRELIEGTRVRFDRQGNVDPKAHGLRTGATAELCQEIARGTPEGFDPYHPIVPWAVFAQRDVSVAASGGGHLVESKVTPVEQLLRPWSITVAGGVELLPNLQGNTAVPKESASLTGYWLGSETTPLTESAPTLAPIPMSPKMCGDVVDVSRLLRLQGANVDAYINSALLRTVGALVDLAVVVGNGVEQPQGIIGTVGVGTASGGTLALSHLLTAREAVAVANANDANLVWVAPPAIRKLMAGRERVTNSGRLLWEDDLVDGRAAYQSTAMPAGDLLLGDLSKVTLGVWGQGLQVEITDKADQAHFMQGITTMRVLAGVDVAVRQPAALYVVTSIT